MFRLTSTTTIFPKRSWPKSQAPFRLRLLRRMLLQISRRLLKRQNHKRRDQDRIVLHPALLADEAAVGFLKRFELVDQLHAPIMLAALRIADDRLIVGRSEEHTSELQSPYVISYA